MTAATTLEYTGLIQGWLASIVAWCKWEQVRVLVVAVIFDRIVITIPVVIVHTIAIAVDSVVPNLIR